MNVTTLRGFYYKNVKTHNLAGISPLFALCFFIPPANKVYVRPFVPLFVRSSVRPNLKSAAPLRPLNRIS